MASLEEVIETDKYGVILNPPGIIRTLDTSLGLVIKVGSFESTQDTQGSLEHLDGSLSFSSLDEIEDGIAIEVGRGLTDESVANFSHEDHKLRGGVVVGRGFPDEEDNMHDRSEVIHEALKVRFVL